MSNLPISQIFDANELESKGIREFFKIELKDTEHTILYFTPHATQMYLDKTWESFEMKLSGMAQHTSGENARPKLTFVNTNHMFSIYIERGMLEGSLVTRYESLITDIEAGVRAYHKKVMVIGKVVSLNKHLCVVELRSTLDGPNFKLPVRAFYPPDFPYVNLR